MAFLCQRAQSNSTFPESPRRQFLSLKMRMKQRISRKVSCRRPFDLFGSDLSAYRDSSRVKGMTFGIVFPNTSLRRLLPEGEGSLIRIYSSAMNHPFSNSKLERKLQKSAAPRSGTG